MLPSGPASERAIWFSADSSASATSPFRRYAQQTDGARLRYLQIALEPELYADPPGAQCSGREKTVLGDRIGEGVEVVGPTGLVADIEEVVDARLKLDMLPGLDARARVDDGVILHRIELVTVIAAQELVGGVDERAADGPLREKWPSRRQP